jgi:DNA-binding GntR family transcriptional regulator
VESFRELTQTPRISLADLAYESILESILTGRLPCGAELNTVSLARQLDISRTPVNEALQRLVADGLVAWPKGRKARVASLTADDIAQIYCVRVQLEALSAELAAKHMSEKVIRQLLRAARQLQSSTVDVDWSRRSVAFDVRLHEVVAKESGNRWLAKEVLSLLRLVRVFFRFAATPEYLSRVHREHIALLEAIQARNGNAARNAMVAHIEASRDVLLSAIETQTNVGSGNHHHRQARG